MIFIFVNDYDFINFYERLIKIVKNDMKNKIENILLIIIISGLIIFSSCAKFEEYPIIPQIEFVSFATLLNSQQKDSLG